MRLEPTRPYEAAANFEPAIGGPRFVLTHRPRGATERGTVVLAPAFAEEMNKCRRMIAQTARALAADGWRVVQIDLYGCGDSGGDFGTASWQQWVADLERAVSMHHSDGELWLWGVRAGALLLSPLLEAMADANLLLWQPAHDGAAVLNQFLRLRASLSLLDRSETADRTRLRARLARGESIEVAGYPLCPQVANHLADARLLLPRNFAGRIAWFDVGDDPADPGSAPRQAVVERWRAAGHQVQFETVAGPKFWQTVETAEAPALIERTRAALAPVAASVRAAPCSGASQPATASLPQPYDEKAVWIDCEGERMLGIVCAPRGTHMREQAVLIPVGGPQYRAGSHRQFVLLARALASAGYASLRFDFRGMGDSEGAARTFEDVEPDLKAAIDALYKEPGVRSVVIWALCDGASAALMFGTADARVGGLVLLNPWVRSETTLATTHLKHYYGQRLLQREFWIRLLRAQFDWRSSLRDLRVNLLRGMRAANEGPARASFQTMMADGWRRFRGSIALMLSGRDLTAKEFLEYAGSDPRWHGLLTLPNVRRADLPEADHTFSDSQCHRWLEEQTLAWLGSMARLPSHAMEHCLTASGTCARARNAPAPIGRSG